MKYTLYINKCNITKHKSTATRLLCESLKKDHIELISKDLLNDDSDRQDFRDSGKLFYGTALL